MKFQVSAKDGYIKISATGYWSRPLVEGKSLDIWTKGGNMRGRTRLLAIVGLSTLLTFTLSSGNRAQSQTHTKGSVVYVCACLKTKSCSCMTEAKMEGPCACGTKGGPPLKEVPSDSDWAKANREELAK
jgi:hypothetical protein